MSEHVCEHTYEHVSESVEKSFPGTGTSHINPLVRVGVDLQQMKFDEDNQENGDKKPTALSMGEFRFSEYSIWQKKSYLRSYQILE